jgi:hypothetical protein
MITKSQAMTAIEFHEDHELAGKVITWRRNGATQTWKTRPGEFRIPVKYGLRSYGQIYDHDAGRFHVASECPTRHVRVTEPDGAGEFFGIYLAEIIADRAGTGISSVRVTTRGASRHRVGSDVRVATGHITFL